MLAFVPHRWTEKWPPAVHIVPTVMASRPAMTCTWSTDSCLRQIGYREKAREEASRGGSLAYRPDIALATEVSKLTSQVPTKAAICP